jgi:hypothetical protein
LVSLAVALLILDLSLTFRNLWPTPAVRWTGDLSVEVAACILLLLLGSRRPGPPSRLALRCLSALWVVLVISRYADVTAPALYGRQVNLYWDVRYLPAVAAMLGRAASLWIVGLVLGAAAAVPMILYAVLRPSLGRIGAAMGHAGERRALGVLAGAVLLLFAAQQIFPSVPALPGFATPVTAAYARQARLVAGELLAARTRSDVPAPAIRADLASVRGADVFLIFLESYGAVSYDRPEFAAALASSRAQLEADIHATGRDVVSAFVESPTFGGNSWLAHVSLLSGVEVRDQSMNLRLMAQKRDTMVSAFAQRGYRTMAIMPGMHASWPEGAFYGFDEIYDEDRLDYQGPPFGWWSVPDQFVLARLDALAAAGTSRAPVFAFFPTTNTHTPFSPTPPYQPDWPRVLTSEPFDSAELQRAWEQYPDWLNLGPSYVHALSYTYQTLGGYLRLRADRDFVMILLGDHQPPAVVSGEGASWEVPVHVIGSRKDILDSLLAQGFRPGLFPRHPAAVRMNALLPILLAAFSDRS